MTLREISQKFLVLFISLTLVVASIGFFGGASPVGIAQAHNAVFGEVEVGESATYDITMTYTSTEEEPAPAHITSYEFTGPNADEFALTQGAIPATLQPGETWTGQITFTPKSEGEKFATLIVANSVNPGVFTLSATAIPSQPEGFSLPWYFPFAIMAGIIAKIGETITNIVVGIINFLTLKFFDDLATGVSTAWSDGSTFGESGVNTAAYLWSLIDPTVGIREGTPELIEATKNGDSFAIGEAMSRITMGVGEIAAMVGGAALALKKGKSISKPSPHEELRTIADEAKSAGNIAKNAEDQRQVKKTVTGRVVDKTATGTPDPTTDSNTSVDAKK